MSIKDKLWWYGSYRHQNIQASLRQLPGQAADDDPQQLQRQGHLQPVDQQQVDRLHAAVAEEAAAALRLVAARRRHRHQQHRSDDVEPELLGVGAQGRVERRDQRQRRSPRSAAASTATTGTTASTAPGCATKTSATTSSTAATATGRAIGAATRCSAPLSYFKNKAGDHNFKIGGEIFDETVKDIFIDGFEDDVLHVMQNNAKLDVILFQPGESIGGLRTYGAFVHDTWRASDRLTFNLGLRFDRYRAFLARAGPPGRAASTRPRRRSPP